MDKKDQIEEFKKQLEEKELKINELTDNWKRALADYQNLEKRIISDRKETSLYLVKALLEKILEVLDLLKSAQKHLNDQGLELVIKKFQDVLSSEGVKRVECHKVKFDPGIMECIEVIEGEPDDWVAEELSDGYTYADILLRPAKVKVFKKVSEDNSKVN